MNKAIAAMALIVTAGIFLLVALAPTPNTDGLARRRADAIENARNGR